MKLLIEVEHYGIGETDVGYAVYRLIRNSHKEIITYVTTGGGEYVGKEGYAKAIVEMKTRNQAVLEKQKTLYGNKKITVQRALPHHLPNGNQ